MTLIDPVLYQLYVGLIAKLSLNLPVLIAFYTSLLCCITPWVWYLFFRELQPDKTVALLGWALLSICPPWISMYSYFMQETLLLPLLGASLLFTWRCQRKQTIASFVLMTFLWCLAGLSRGICIPLAVLAVSWIWFSQPSKIPKALLALALLLLILGPLAVRGYEKMKIFAPHGVSYMSMIYAKSGNRQININFEREGAHWSYGYVSPSMGIEPFAPLSQWKTQRTGNVDVHIVLDKGWDDWNVAIENQAMNAQKYLWITKENLIFLFFAESWPNSNRAKFLGNLNYLLRWIWAPLTLICIIWIAIRWMKPERQFLLPAIIGVWLLFQGFLPLAVNEGRYRLPFTGLLIAQILLLAGTRKQMTIADVSLKLEKQL